MIMGEDQGIYNAIVIALVIGIIVVIATLLFQKPQPESFTELYFNDHKALPSFVEDDERYNFSFSIVNHENQDMKYNYTVKKTLYRWDYTCETPKPYFDTAEDTPYSTLLDRDYPTPTRIASSTDPSLLIRHDKYQINFRYRLLSGAGQVVFRLKGIDQNTLYSFVINEAKQESYFISPLKERHTKPISIAPGEIHEVYINASNESLQLIVDGQIVFDKKGIKKYTVGFPEIELTQSYGQISNFQIIRHRLRQNVYFRFADQEHISIDLLSRQSLLGESFLMDLSRATGEEQSLSIQYYAEEPVNLTDYSLEFRFMILEGEKASIGIEDGFELFIYPEDNSTSFIYPAKEMTLLNKSINVSSNSYALRFDVLGEQVRVTLNSELLYEVNDARLPQQASPVIAAYNAHLKMDDLRLVSLEKPIYVNYDIPSEVRPKVTYTRVPDVRVYESAKVSPQQEEYVRGLFEKEEINSSEYKIDGAFVDPQKNNSVLLTFNDPEKSLYSVKVNGAQNAVIITYQKDGVQKTQKVEVDLSQSIIHNIELDVKNNTLAVVLDNKEIFSEEIDETTKGLLFMDHPKTVNVPRLEVNKKDTNELRIHRNVQMVCNPVEIKDYQENQSSYIPFEDSKTFSSTFGVEDEFDIAKVEVALENGQEIHFWVART